jgi:hypothetical protein
VVTGAAWLTTLNARGALQAFHFTPTSSATAASAPYMKRNTWKMRTRCLPSALA